jgi:glycosyltransferase involved in cell wall biosynthesis
MGISMMSSSIHLLHTIQDISQDKGGLPIAVLQLLESLAWQNADLSIQLAAKPGKIPLLTDSQVLPNFNWLSLPKLNYWAVQQLIAKNIRTQQKSFILHDHGIWLPYNHGVAAACRRFGIPRVVSPHGMLEPWAWQYKAWKKGLAWSIFQHHDLETVQVLHATGNSEATNLRNFFPDIPIAMIPLGIDLPSHSTLQSTPSKKNKKTLLFLSRIHEKKGLLNLVEAWAYLRPKNWELIIAGPNEREYQAIVERKIQELNLSETISFPGEVIGEAKWQLYHEADLFVLPSFSENFGMVVAEALACETPVITTKGTPWSELEAYRCGWWINFGVMPLLEALQEAISLSDGELRAMGQRGRMLIEAKYSWEQTTKQMSEVYNWVLGQGEKPVSLVD